MCVVPEEEGLGDVTICGGVGEVNESWGGGLDCVVLGVCVCSGRQAIM